MRTPSAPMRNAARAKGAPSFPPGNHTRKRRLSADTFCSFCGQPHLFPPTADKLIPPAGQAHPCFCRTNALPLPPERPYFSSLLNTALFLTASSRISPGALFFFRRSSSSSPLREFSPWGQGQISDLQNGPTFSASNAPEGRKFRPITLDADAKKVELKIASLSRR